MDPTTNTESSRPAGWLISWADIDYELVERLGPEIARRVQAGEPPGAIAMDLRMAPHVLRHVLSTWQRKHLRPEILLRLAAGEPRKKIARELGIHASLLYRIVPADCKPAADTPSGPVGGSDGEDEEKTKHPRPVRDKRLKEALGMCPQCGRLKLLPCSACDPNQ